MLFGFEGAIIKGFPDPAFRTLLLGFCLSLKEIAKELLLIELPLETNKQTNNKLVLYIVIFYLVLCLDLALCVPPHGNALVKKYVLIKN